MGGLQDKSDSRSQQIVKYNTFIAAKQLYMNVCITIV